ncbi:glycosyltransferase family 10 [Herbaspirillum sp.]|uniref:glycosyltransferase family 10 domain-containing protein n=1 Tax=Herbaspirillum sp. TaxID=1890675 RepID=UPI0031D77792
MALVSDGFIAMINIKVTTCAPSWDWSRQLPDKGPDWGPFRFHIDTEIEECDFWFVFESVSELSQARCPRENVVFITGEPDAIGTYSKEFLAQFAHVVSGRADIQHAGLIRSHQGHPWFVEKSYDELKLLSRLPKSKAMCVLTSAKAFTPGHQARLNFVSQLQARFGKQIDVFGRGIRDFDSKWDILSEYRYTVVIENHHGPDFITEKLPDAWLAFCMPFYWGCSNVEQYCSSDSLIAINPHDVDAASSLIEKHLADSSLYESYLPSLVRARNYYLDHMQFFALARDLAAQFSSRGSTVCRELVTLRPQGQLAAKESKRSPLARLFRSGR